jgi:hypothetical protein
MRRPVPAFLERRISEPRRALSGPSYVEDRSVHVYTDDQTVRVLQVGDRIEEPTLLPGFFAPIALFFEGL